MLDKQREFEIGDKKYNFQMTIKTILKCDEKYGNYGSIIYGILQGVQFYTNAFKLLTCTCIEREFTLEELTNEITPSQAIGVSTFVIDLYRDFIGETENKEDDEVSKKK